MCKYEHLLSIVDWTKYAITEFTLLLNNKIRIRNHDFEKTSTVEWLNNSDCNSERHSISV